MSLTLAHLWALLALPLPLLVIRLLPPAPVTEGATLHAPLLLDLVPIMQQQHQPPPLLRWLALLAWGLLVLAAARPQWVGEPIVLPVTGRDLMLAVDLSGSMSEQDMVVGVRVVDRLTAVKAVAGDFISQRSGDRIGLILFGSQAYLQAPLTFDRDTVRRLLFESVVGLAGNETAIGDAIGLAVKHLRAQSMSDQSVLILLTDGVNNAGMLTPERATELAAQAGIRVYTIAFGGEPRGPFAMGLGGHPIDEASLKAIADATGGRYFRARNLHELQTIYAAMDELEPLEADTRQLRPTTELFAWPLAAALFVSLVLAARAGNLFVGFFASQHQKTGS